MNSHMGEKLIETSQAEIVAYDFNVKLKKQKSTS